jgi:hypothetical protein
LSAFGAPVQILQSRTSQKMPQSCSPRLLVFHMCSFRFEL